MRRLLDQARLRGIGVSELPLFVGARSQRALQVLSCTLGLAWCRSSSSSSVICHRIGGDLGGLKLLHISLHPSPESPPRAPGCSATDEGRGSARSKKGFATAVARAGLTDVHPHDLRRICGRWLVQQGVPIQVVSNLLRHSDLHITDRVYAHLSPTTVQAAVEVLDQPANRGTVSRWPKMPTKTPEVTT